MSRSALASSSNAAAAETSRRDFWSVVDGRLVPLPDGEKHAEEAVMREAVL